MENSWNLAKQDILEWNAIELSLENIPFVNTRVIEEPEYVAAALDSRSPKNARFNIEAEENLIANTL
ncbi:hypothetical protein Tco_0691554 [Tanacetum coccineum]